MLQAVFSLKAKMMMFKVIQSDCLLELIYSFIISLTDYFSISIINYINYYVSSLFEA